MQGTVEEAPEKRTGQMLTCIVFIILIIILLQVMKHRWRARARSLQNQANAMRLDEQQRARDQTLLIALLYAINKGNK